VVWRANIVYMACGKIGT